MRQLGQVGVAKRMALPLSAVPTATGCASGMTSCFPGIGSFSPSFKGPACRSVERSMTYSLRSLYSWVLPTFQFCTGR